MINQEHLGSLAITWSIQVQDHIEWCTKSKFLSILNFLFLTFLCCSAKFCSTVLELMRNCILRWFAENTTRILEIDIGY